MRFRLFEQKDFGKTDGYCAYEGGEGLIYPPEFWESHESYRRRLAQFPEGCWACVNDKDEVLGYMFCHPWDDTFVPLDCRTLEIPKNPTCLYVHDIAVIPAWRRKGIATTFIDMAKKIAIKHGFERLKGVSVLGSLTHWQKCGFIAVEEIPYGENHKGTIIELIL